MYGSILEFDSLSRMISELTLQRLRRFKSIRRAYVSFLILAIAFVLSLLSEFIANDKPIYLRYDGHSYFPVVKFYPADRFGGPYKTEADYLALKEDKIFQSKGGWMIFPIIPHGPYHSYLNLEGNPPHHPSLTHLLGTDNIARDVLTRLIYGFRICMLFAVILAATSSVFGIIIGGVQGYFGGKLDIIFQRMIEIWSSLPFLYVVILLSSIYGRSFTLLIFILSIFEWIGLSYYMRGEFFKLKDMTYVKVARAVGFGHVRIFFRQILPNALTPVITLLPFVLIAGISALTSLDFLGFGLQPPTPSWGEMLKQGLDSLHAPWVALSAIGALFSTLLLATFIGEGLREAFDPKSNQRIE
jgi:microcin C transport system permease protein